MSGKYIYIFMLLSFLPNWYCIYLWSFLIKVYFCRMYLVPFLSSNLIESTSLYLSERMGSMAFSKMIYKPPHEVVVWNPRTGTFCFPAFNVKINCICLNKMTFFSYWPIPIEIFVLVLLLMTSWRLIWSNNCWDSLVLYK